MTAATLSVVTSVRAGAIQTINQLGGHGSVSNTCLAVPGHLNGPTGTKVYNSYEFVELAPAEDTEWTRVGAHLQHTDEIYYMVAGRGILTTHGQDEPVETGDLVIAPKGTYHSIATQSGCAFVVVELVTPTTEVYPPLVIKHLPGQQARDLTFHRASDRTHATRAPFKVARIDLSVYFTAPWGVLSLVELPAWGQTDEYVVEGADELLFQCNVESGYATLKAGGHTFHAGMHGIGLFEASPADGLSTVIPAGMPRQLINRSCRPGESLLILSLEVRRNVEVHGDHTQPACQEAVA